VIGALAIMATLLGLVFGVWSVYSGASKEDLKSLARRDDVEALTRELSRSNQPLATAPRAEQPHTVSRTEPWNHETAGAARPVAGERGDAPFV